MRDFVKGKASSFYSLQAVFHRGRTKSCEVSTSNLPNERLDFPRYLT